MSFIPPPPYSKQNLKLYEAEQIGDDQASEEWEDWEEWEEWDEAEFEAAARTLQDTGITSSAPKVVEELTPPPRRLPKKRNPRRRLSSKIQLSGDDERRIHPAAGPFFERQEVAPRENVPRPPSPLWSSVSLPHVLLSDIVGPEPAPPPRNAPRRMGPRPTSTNSVYLPPSKPEEPWLPPHMMFDPSIAYNGSDPVNQPLPQPYEYTSLYKYIFLFTYVRSTAHLVLPAQRLSLIYHRVRPSRRPIESPRM
jgi:hypothetical protein